MASLTEVGNHASRSIAIIWFWAFPVLVSTLYSMLTFDTSPKANRHAFEQGVSGFLLLVGATAIISAINIIGFSFALALVPRVHNDSSRTFYLLAATCGLISLIAFETVTRLSKSFVSSSNGFWFVFFIAGAITLSFSVSLVFLSIALGAGGIKASSNGGETEPLVEKRDR